MLITAAVILFLVILLGPIRLSSVHFLSLKPVA
jgi:hypothetical protein